MKRHQALKYLTKHAGKGVKGNLKRLRIINDNQAIQQTIIDKEQIEREIINYNQNHFKQAYQSEMHNDRIYAELDNNEIRNNIFNGQLRHDQCENENAHEFLKFVTNTNRINITISI